MQASTESKNSQKDSPNTTTLWRILQYRNSTNSFQFCHGSGKPL